MPRPKKAPRERLQITMKKDQVAELKKFAKKRDRDVSDVIGFAVGYYMRETERQEKAAAIIGQQIAPPSLTP